MIEFLTSPALYVITTVICVLALAHDWKSERSQRLFRGTLALALVGNVAMLVLSVS